MTIKEYQTIIEKTAVYPKEIGLAYCAMGLTGEAGEVSDKIKKLYRDRDLLNKSFETMATTDEYVEIRNGLKKELGDVMWYVTAMANEMNLSLESIMQANYDKLIKRRDTNTLHGSGDNREEVYENQDYQ
jgi:NTP pyrophosphatase (non-canonical NTP hydrolase)